MSVQGPLTTHHLKTTGKVDNTSFFTQLKHVVFQRETLIRISVHFNDHLLTTVVHFSNSFLVCKQDKLNVKMMNPQLPGSHSQEFASIQSRQDWRHLEIPLENV